MFKLTPPHTHTKYPMHFLQHLVCYTLVIPNLCSEKKRNHFLGMPWLAARKLIIPARDQPLLRLPHTHSAPPPKPDFVKPQKCQEAHSKTLFSPIPFSHLFHFAFSGISKIYILILFFSPLTSRRRKCRPLLGGSVSGKACTDCLQLLVSGGVRACSPGTTPSAFAIQRPSFNFLCTQKRKKKDSRPKMVVFWSSMCLTTQ